MTKMIVRYERKNGLNVRKEPNRTSKVVRKMRQGEEAECFEVREGWCKLADGFVDAAYVIVKLGETAKAASAAIEAKAEVVSVAEEPEEPEASVEAEDAPEASGDDEYAALKKMTNPQLYQLAEQSGIKVKKGANKSELIAAILAADE